MITDKLESIALKEKLKLAFYVLIVLLFLNSCLLACFYLGQKTFLDDSDTLGNLGTFYHRKNCLDNLLMYSLEQFIQNDTISLNLGLENKFSQYADLKSFSNGAQYYLTQCQLAEKNYNTLRQSLPNFMVDV